MTKSIALELPDWANWIAQDKDGEIWLSKTEPTEFYDSFITNDKSKPVTRICDKQIENWRDSKINLQEYGAYIDAEGILHRCELVPDMLQKQAG